MNSLEASDLGQHISDLIDAGQDNAAYALLAPVLAQRTPFRLLDRVGAALGGATLTAGSTFLQRIAADRSEGGWVVIGSALGGQLARDAGGTVDRCRAFIIAADVWYGADILGDRVPGPALVSDFQPSLALLSPWRVDDNRWVRRAVGIAAHFWAKRSKGDEKLSHQAQELLAFLEPMFEEWEMDAAKGVGWGLKTIGRHYPELVASWLHRQLCRPHRALMLRKALTYLPEVYKLRLSRPRRTVSEQEGEAGARHVVSQGS